MEMQRIEIETIKANRLAGESGASDWVPSRSEEEAGEAALVLASCLAAAAQGDITAYFDLGVAYSTGSHGVEYDLIEAHKWFNIAAARGHEEAACCRVEISQEMSKREIAEAQRRARRWMAQENRCAA